LHVRTRSHGKRRAAFYACTSHYNREPEVCPHVEQYPMEAVDNEVLAAIAGDALRPDLVNEIVDAAREMYETAQRPDHTAVARPELDKLERAGANHRGDSPLRRRRDSGGAAAKHGSAAARADRNAEGIRDGAGARVARDERRIRESLQEWRSLLLGDVAQARQAFRQLLTTPIMFTPFVERGRCGVRFEGRVGLERF
jgi:hypothetical protein